MIFPPFPLTSWTYFVRIGSVALSIACAFPAFSATPKETSLAVIESGKADEKTKAALLEWARDKDLHTRAAAIVALGTLGDASPGVLQVLEKGLDYPDEVTRSNAASALMVLGDDGKAILERRLDAPIPLRARLEAMMALRNSVAGLKDPALREKMEAIYKEIKRASHPDLLEDSDSILGNGNFAEPDVSQEWLFIQADGGKGSATWDQDISRHPGSGSVLLEKQSAAGEVVLRSKNSFLVKAGETPVMRLYFRADEAPSLSMLQLLFEDEKGVVRIGDQVRGHAAQSQTALQNVASGQWEKRVAQINASDKDARYHVRVVLKGNPARVWIDDISAPAAPYTYDYPPGMRSAIEPARTDVAEPANPVDVEVVQKNGHPRIVIDGKETSPILYFNQRGLTGDYAGMSAIGKVPLMVMTVPLNEVVDERYPPQRAVWNSMEKFDFSMPFAWMDHALMNAPENYFIINFNINWPKEWAARYPEELWENAKGEKAYGTTIHMRGFAEKLPGGHDETLQKSSYTDFRWWPSPFSQQAIEDAAKAIEQFTLELKNKPYANRVIGCFISGGHDGQFYTASWPDYSNPAVKVFREWLTERYGSDEELRRAWGDESVSLGTAEIPIYEGTKSEQNGFYNPLTERQYADHMQFQSEAGLRIREQLASAFKRAKDTKSIGMTWQLGGGRGQGAETIFLNKDGLDVLVAQPAYHRRRPGLSGGLNAPLTSYGEHNKMLVKELDLRTWMRAGGPEIPSYRLGTATSPEMFRQIVRKEAAPMLARGHGFWFYDISTSMLRDPEMMEIAAETVRAYEELELQNTTPYQPEIAVVFNDESAYWVHDGFGSGSFIRTLENLTPFHLRESGLVYDQIYLNDLLKEDRAKAYKMLIFIDAWRLSDAQREGIRTKLKNSGRYLVWNFASGYVSDHGLDDAAASELVGMQVRSDAITKLPRVSKTDEQKSAPGAGEVSFLMAKQGSSSRNLPKGARSFVIEDENAKPLAHYEDGTVAIATRSHEDWTSIYFGLPGTLDATLLSQLAAEAGAHRLSESRVIAEFNGRFLSLHGLQNGPVSLNFPASGTLIDFSTGETAGKGQKMTVPVQAGETHWFKFTPDTNL